MTRRATLLSVFLLALACASCGGTETSEAPPQAPVTPSADAASSSSKPRIVALGDSLTAGFGLVESQAYPAVLQRTLNAEGYNFEVVNAGVSGDTTAGGLRRLEWALEGDVRVLIVALGGNDGLRGLSVGQMKENLIAIIEGARQRNVIVVLAGMEAPPNYGPEYTSAFRAGFQDVARSQRVLFLPFLLDRVAGNASLNQGDGIHPNPQGAEIVAETVWKVLRPVLDQMSTS